MEIELTENLEKILWEELLEHLPEGAEILQSPVWQGICEAEGIKVRQFCWRQAGKVAAMAQILESTKGGCKFWYIPRGPLCFSAAGDQTLWTKVLADLKKMAEQNRVTALRYEPEAWPVEINNFGNLQTHIQPPKTIYLDLHKSEEELLAAMHPKTRYNIRLAEKREVTVRPGKGDDLLIFWQLMQKTTARDRFRGHNLNHYRHLIEASGGAIQLWLAEKAGQVLAAGIFSFYQGRAVYMHGASADEGREHMAPHLLQWRMIQTAKAAGCLYYDFYGIDEQKWPGVTRFKRGFGGFEKEYPGTFLMVINSRKYRLYNLMAELASLWRRIINR